MLSQFAFIVTTAGAYLMVYSVIIGSDPERSRLSVILSLEPELLCFGSRDVVSHLPRRFRNWVFISCARGLDS